jgi:serine/threonine protein kinase
VISRRYEIEKELGRGMLGVTYLARHVSSNKYLCLKFLRAPLISHPIDREKFKTVFEAVGGVKHEGLIRQGEIGEHNGWTYFTEEYFPSQSLRELIDEYQKAARTFTLLEACQIAVRVLEVVEQLHQKGLIHRNLKPENVLVASRNTGPGGKNVVRTIKVSDAGLSDLVKSTIFAESYLSRADAKYLAPELSGFEQAGSPQADIYSVGVMLYELLVGQPPRGTYLSPTQLRSDLPEHIDDVVELALDPSVGGRYPTARDMINDIQRSFDEDLTARVDTGSSRRTVIGIATLAVLLAAVGGWFALREKEDPVEAAKKADNIARVKVIEKAKARLPEEAALAELRNKHPDMLYIPPGPFLSGRFNQEPLDQTSATEHLTQEAETEAFYIDRFEYPNRLTDKEGKPIPAVGRVTWIEAESACKALGKRLCTDLEWEKACRGPANSIYTYGDTYNAEICGAGIEDQYIIGARKECVSGYGVSGLSGGPREWTSKVAGSKGTRRIVKGGLRGGPAKGTRCAFAVDESVDFAEGSLSFRCCADLDVPAGAPEPPAEEGEAPANK